MAAVHERDDQGVDELTDLVMVVRYENQLIPETDTVARLADILREQGHACIDIQVVQVQAVGANGRLADVTFRVEGAHNFDENGFAHPKVTVTLPDGREEFAFYKLDGNA